MGLLLQIIHKSNQLAKPGSSLSEFQFVSPTEKLPGTGFRLLQHCPFLVSLQASNKLGISFLRHLWQPCFGK
ncbi:MAG TPA: hypothetical protein DDY32_02465 [Desulfobulbaceae bacterium]|nr:hypothetical protein [Desulfobulbaceae bacterium]